VCVCALVVCARECVECGHDTVVKESGRADFHTLNTFTGCVPGGSCSNRQVDLCVTDSIAFLFLTLHRGFTIFYNYTTPKVRGSPFAFLTVLFID